MNKNCTICNKKVDELYKGVEFRYSNKKKKWVAVHTECMDELIVKRRGSNGK